MRALFLILPGGRVVEPSKLTDPPAPAKRRWLPFELRPGSWFGDKYRYCPTGWTFVKGGGDSPARGRWLFGLVWLESEDPDGRRYLSWFNGLFEVRVALPRDHHLRDHYHWSSR